MTWLDDLLAPVLDGWRPSRSATSEAVFDELMSDGAELATVVQYHDTGLFYATAVSPEGIPLQSGAMAELVDAIRWAEQASGFWSIGRPQPCPKRAPTRSNRSL